MKRHFLAKSLFFMVIAVANIAHAQAGFKLLAEGSDKTKTALILIKPFGIFMETAHKFSYQKVNAFVANSPFANNESVGELVFEVSLVDGGGYDFCAGGSASFDIVTGATGAAKCTEYKVQDKYYQTKTVKQVDWIRLRVNGQDINSCPDMFGRQPASASHEAVYGRGQGSKLYCHYKVGQDWTGEISELQIVEACGTYGMCNWNWKIWYKEGDPSNNETQF